MRTLFLYVDNFYIGEKRTAWPLLRVLRQLRNRFPNAHELEVTAEKRPAGSATSVLRTRLYTQ